MNKVIIRPNNIPTDIDRIMGFDKYEEGRFPGCKTGMPLFKFANGAYRHGVPDGEDKKFIEKELLNGADLDSEQGRQYLSTVVIELGSDVQFIDGSNAEDLLKYFAMLSTKDIIAPSRKDAKEKIMSHRLYIIEEYGEDKKEKLNIRQKVNKAKYKLTELETESDYMIALAQYLAPVNAGIKSEEQAYIFIDELLAGKYTDDSELMGVNRFESALKVSKDEIFITAVVKEAIYKNVIRKTNGVFINPNSKTTLGRTEAEVINYLLQDENQDELGMNLITDKPYSIRYLLKTKDNYKK